jgi:hypothetical protein
MAGATLHTLLAIYLQPKGALNLRVPLNHRFSIPQSKSLEAPALLLQVFLEVAEESAEIDPLPDLEIE